MYAVQKRENTQIMNEAFEGEQNVKNRFNRDHKDLTKSANEIENPIK